MHFSVRQLNAKKYPAVFIQRQTNYKQAQYTWKSITYTSSLKNQNKWGSWICTKGINSKETISLIHPKCCVPLQQIQAPELELFLSSFSRLFSSPVLSGGAGWTAGSQQGSAHHKGSTVWQMKTEVLSANPGLAGVQTSAPSIAGSPHTLIQQFLTQQFNLSKLSRRNLHQILHNF